MMKGVGKDAGVTAETEGCPGKYETRAGPESGGREMLNDRQRWSEGWLNFATWKAESAGR